MLAPLQLMNIFVVVSFIHHTTSLRQISPLKTFFTKPLTDQRNGLRTSILRVRGGLFGASNIVSTRFQEFNFSPDKLFDNIFITLLCNVFALQFLNRISTRRIGIDKNSTLKKKNVKSLQLRFLVVFWLMRMADWLQGPYFYEVYSTKIINGLPVSLDLVSKLFLIGFASTGLLGPWLGQLVDNRGRKAGTLAYAFFYALGALSTLSNKLSHLFLGRVASGVGTSLLFSAPEAWLVKEHSKDDVDGKWLNQTFGWAYAGDAIIAILAGQIASGMAKRYGPTGPFLSSILYLALGSFLAYILWGEKQDVKLNDENVKKEGLREAFQIINADRRIVLVGMIQALFEGAMYIFVLQWAPILRNVIQSAFTNSVSIPYGKIFSCFMVSCLMGSTLFNVMISKLNFPIEFIIAMLTSVSMASFASISFIGEKAGLGSVILAFLIFEVCVGMYFPSIGTLRSKYIPDRHRSTIMSIFGIPLNMIVIAVSLSIKYLGSYGALKCVAAALGLAFASSTVLIGCR